MQKQSTHKINLSVFTMLMTALTTVGVDQALAQDTVVATPPIAKPANAGKSKSDLQVGKIYFISSDSLNVRSSSVITPDNIIGKLSLNDQVELYDVLNEATPFVQVKIVKSATFTNTESLNLFISKDYLSEKELGLPDSKYFVIQNVATEKTRVYERCTSSPNCPHKLVMETEMVVGRPEVGTKENPHAFKTWLGHAKISEWIKFYQDGLKHYPHWYQAGQNLKDIPKPLTKGLSKLTASQRWMVKNEHGDTTIYGAFGWYAAKVTPFDEFNGMNYQWMHGTIGWGADGSAPIELTRSFMLNLLSDPGSSGCTRLENRAIAYLRYLLPVGTDIFRVYAREATREEEIVNRKDPKTVLQPLPRYADKFKNPKRWEYILLTDGAQQSGGLTADANTIIQKGIQVIYGYNLIETGNYDVDQYPNATPLNYDKSAHSGVSGDRYEIDQAKDRFKETSNFYGFFLVDEGRFVNYQHPDAQKTKGVIHVSGLPDFRHSVPEFLKTSGYYNVPVSK